jgi:hypothetical protein
VRSKHIVCLPSRGLNDDVNIDVDVSFNDYDQDSFNTGPDEDNPNLFLLEKVLDPCNKMSPHTSSLYIYALVSWLHLQVHLPRVACNGLLAIFACLLISLSPAIDTLFITLQSSNHVLNADKSIYVLPVCPIY